MSVTGPTSASTTAGSDRLSRAISAAKASVPKPTAPDASTADLVAPAPRTTTSTPPRGTSTGSTTATHDAARGAKAAPDAATTGTDAADLGAAQVMGAGQPGTAPDPVPTAADTGVDPALEADPTASPERTVQPIQGTGAWTPDWQRRFEKLQLVPSDIEFLAQAGYTDDQLFDIATQLDQVAPIDPTATDPYAVDPYAPDPITPAPQPGVDAGSVASADGPLPQDVATQGSAWSPQWEQRFGDVMKRMGMPPAEIDAQLKSVHGQPTTEEQLSQAYRQMEQSLGAFNDDWKAKFTQVMTDLKTPQAEQEQVLQQLASSGLDESKLTEAYTQMQNSLPAWSKEYENKFKSLGIPEDLLNQIKDSGAPKTALDQQFQQMVDTKMQYKNDGRLKRLQDAKATATEQWGVMTEGISGKDFDKAVEQIHSAHVPGWKRALSFGINIIPGVYALQYITGKDWATGEKIDRSNPLNIVGAVASGFAGFTAIRSSVQIIQGMSNSSRAAAATMQAAQGAKTLSTAVTSLGQASPLSQGALHAAEAAGVASKLQTGFKLFDYVKAAAPGFNRFGEAGRLSSFGRGYYQGTQLAAGAASLKALEGGKVGVDAAMKSTMLSELKQGRSIQEAMLAAGRSTGDASKFAMSVDDIAAGYSRYGFLQGGAGKLAEGNKVLRGSGNFRFSPFKNHATIGTTANPNVLSLGRNVNFGTNGGLAQGLGAVQGASAVRNEALYTHAMVRATGANQLLNAGNAQKMAGINIADDVQRIETMTRTADWANKLSVTGGSKFRTLLQLGGSNRTAARITGMVENGGSQGYRAARMGVDTAQRFGNFAVAPLVAGAAVGFTGKTMQPGWEYWKNRDEVRAEEAAQAELAEQEAQELERLYAEQHGGAAPAGGAVPTGGAAPAPGGAQVVGTSPTGGQLVFDPGFGAVIDTSNGDIYDPNSRQLVGNLAQLQGAAQPAGATAPQAAGTAGTTGGAGTAGGGEAGVYVDAAGMYVDPQTGLKADPSTGAVYDAQGRVVGNVNQPAA